MAGKPWYTSGIAEIQVDITKGEVIPEGYRRGRKPLTTSQKEVRTQKYRNAMQLKSSEEIAAIQLRRSESIHNNYQKKSAIERQQIISKRRKTMESKSEIEKANYSLKLSLGSKGKNKGKIPWNKGMTSITDARVKKLALKVSATNKRKYAQIKCTDPQYFKKWREAVSLKMKQNDTYNRSSDEEVLYQELIALHGNENVIRQYRDVRYPFCCDFYISSEDLFIELNKHWTHGKHPFNANCPEDIRILEEWKKSADNSDFYKNAIYVWTDLDVRKSRIAKENNLNYIAIY